jgi:hypothetical protein
MTEIILCRLERPLPGHQPETPHRIEMLELEEEVEVPIQVEVPVDAKSRDDLKKQLEMLIWYRCRYQHYHCTIKSNNSVIGVGSVVNRGTQRSTPQW